MRSSKNDTKESARRRLVFDDAVLEDNNKNSGVRQSTNNAVKNLSGMHSSNASKRTMHAFVTEKMKKKDPFSTPQRLHKKPRASPPQDDEPYVPTYIHKNVAYLRRGETKLDAVVEKTFGLVVRHCIVPQDFENNRKYGPLSGTSFEERVIAAYNLGLLQPNGPESDGIEICSACGVEGHKRDECPKLI